MKRASRHRAGLRCWTKNGEPFLVRVCRRLPPWGHHWPYPNGTTLPVHFRFPIANCRLNNQSLVSCSSTAFTQTGIGSIGNWQSEIGNVLVDLARLERATSTFAQSRSDSIELQVPLIFQIEDWARACRSGFSVVSRHFVDLVFLRRPRSRKSHEPTRNEIFNNLGGGDRSRTCTRRARRFSKPLPYR
jgi:hypothetical protein